MKNSKGFTLTELIIAISVSIVLIVASIGLYLSVSSQRPFIVTRNTLSTNLENALNRINDDVRISSSVAVYNISPDPNAPTTKSGYTDVPGPSPGDTDNQHYWRMSKHRLILNQTPTDASGNPIYDNVSKGAGKRNTVIYYVKDGALYRRLVAASYPNNAKSTTTCVTVPTGGCQDKDIKIIDGLDPDKGENAFSVTYYDVNGNTIHNTKQDPSNPSDPNATVPDYTSFPLTRSIGINISLKSGEVQGLQTISHDNSMRMTLRTQADLTPTISPPTAPPELGPVGLMAGPGGLLMVMGNGVTLGSNAYVRGKIRMGVGSSIATQPVPTKTWAANKGCGSGASFPQLCASEPIVFAGTTSNRIYGDVCATGQVNDSVYGSTKVIRPAGMYTQGLIPGCVAPDVEMPSFDKGKFTASMKQTKSAGLMCGNQLEADTTYNGNLTLGIGLCQPSMIMGNVYVQGDLLKTNTATPLIVSEDVGKVRPIIVVNGTVSIQGGTIVPNSYGTTPVIISFASTDSVCSQSPSCTTISPANLYASAGTIGNRGSGAIEPFGTIDGIMLGVGTKLPGTTVYAYFSKATLVMANDVGAIAGQTIVLGNGADVTITSSF
ncbi:MAG: type II secretion system protein [Candidatus Saccharimonadales bacterium]